MDFIVWLVCCYHVMTHAVIARSRMDQNHCRVEVTQNLEIPEYSLLQEELGRFRPAGIGLNYCKLLSQRIKSLKL